jgi:hypothetical protein
MKIDDPAAAMNAIAKGQISYIYLQDPATDFKQTVTQSSRTDKTRSIERSMRVAHNVAAMMLLHQELLDE